MTFPRRLSVASCTESRPRELSGLHETRHHPWTSPRYHFLLVVRICVSLTFWLWAQAPIKPLYSFIKTKKKNPRELFSSHSPKRSDPWDGTPCISLLIHEDLTLLSCFAARRPMFSPLKHCYKKSLDRLLECLCTAVLKKSCMKIDLFLTTTASDWAWNRDAIGKPHFIPWSRSKSFYLSALISSCLQLAAILSTLQTYRQRARKSKGRYQDSVLGSTAERIAAHVRARQRQTLGEFLPQNTSKWEDHRKSIQVTSWS